MSQFQKYCILHYTPVTLVTDDNDTLPSNDPNTSNFLGQKYEEKSKHGEVQKLLKVLPFYNYMNSLEDILSKIKSLLDIYGDYNRIKTIHINPFDRSCCHNSLWREKSYNQKEGCIQKSFKRLMKYFHYVFLFPEFSEDGRFHYHGIIFLNKTTDIFPFRENLNRRYSNRTKSNKNTIAVLLDNVSRTFLESSNDDPTLKNRTSGINYITKDYSYMKSLRFLPIILPGHTIPFDDSIKISKKHIVIDVKSLDYGVES